MALERWDDETLMAYADGELDAETARLVEAALGEDAEVRARVAAFRQSASAARDAFRGSGQAPVPERLVKAALGLAGSEGGAEVVALRPRPARPVAPRRVAGWAMAAAVAGLVVGFAGGRLAPPDDGPGVVRPAAAPAAGLDQDPAFAAALRRALDGGGAAEGVSWKGADGRAGGRILVLGPVDAGLGTLCRSFKVAPAGPARPFGGIACREADGGWASLVLPASGP